MRNRQKVIAAATRIFTTRGPAASMREIAAEAGVGFAGAIGAAQARPVDTDGVVAELDRVLRELAEAAQAAGELRDDVGPLESGLLLAGAAMAPGDAGSVSHPGSARDTYLTVVLDGLRQSSRGASGSPPAP